MELLFSLLQPHLEPSVGLPVIGWVPMIRVLDKINERMTLQCKRTKSGNSSTSFRTVPPKHVYPDTFRHCYDCLLYKQRRFLQFESSTGNIRDPFLLWEEMTSPSSCFLSQRKKKISGQMHFSHQTFFSRMGSGSRKVSKSFAKVQSSPGRPIHVPLQSLNQELSVMVVKDCRRSN